MELSFEELDKLYQDNFSLGFFDKDGNNRLALISLICYLYDKLKGKNPNLTYWSLIWKLGKSTNMSEEYLKRLAVICKEFGYGSPKYNNFGIKDSDIPEQIKKIMNTWLPF